MCSMRRLRNGFTLGLVLFALSQGVVGCSKNGAPPHVFVEGTVTWQDGTPAKELEGAIIEIETSNKTPPGGGTLKADGTFGPLAVPAGTNRVLIESAPGKEIPLDPRFQSWDTSGLTYTAWDSRKDVTFKVDKSAK